MDIPPDIPNYDIKGTLAQSHYCTIFSARNRATNADVALKVVPRSHLSDPAILAAFEQECRVHESLRHESVIQIIEILYHPSYVCIVMELGRDGDLLQWITSTQYRPASVVIAYFRQILQGVQFLHSRGIAHLDLKPENIIRFGADAVKLTDFGCCESVANGRPITSSGTPVYAAPEILRGDRQDNRPADVWSVGIILCAMQTRQLPFTESPDGVEQQILNGKMTLPVAMPEWARAIFRQCCQVDPYARPTAAQLLNLPAFRQAEPGRRALGSARHGIAGRRRLPARAAGRMLLSQREQKRPGRSAPSGAALGGWRNARRASRDCT
jgi:serine/threonine protein kinase